MEFEPIQLEKNNRLAVDYNNQHTDIQQYFHYRPFGDDQNRMTDIKNRTYQRQELAEVLLEMNQSWGAGNETITQIERLKDTSSTVVIGGQQAGLLTGPIYTMNKLISIIKLARDKEAKLKQPVIPVFWIAGEDHDFAEIDHIFSIKANQKSYKHRIGQHETVGKSVSDIEIDKTAAKKWLRHFLNDLPETRYSAIWYDETIKSLEASRTYTDFFARLVFQLFPQEGIVLVDAHDQKLRQLESGYFHQFLTHQQEIAGHVHSDLQLLQQKGYPIALEVEPNSANLFYHDEQNRRILLEREQEDWIGKKEEVLKTTSEMFSMADLKPWRLSTNVVTRPMMQELLFPTLAFVAGDGEISYWATLKHAFEALDIKMPPVVPRLSLTYITQRTEKLLDKRAIQAKDVIREGTGTMKQQWLLAQTSVPVDTMFDEAKKSMDHIHAPLRQYAASISPNLRNEADKNMKYIDQQMDDFHKRVINHLETWYEAPLNHFDELENELHPYGGLQERVWNPFILINQYGKDFLQLLLEDQQLSFEHEHEIVYLEE